MDGGNSKTIALVDELKSQPVEVYRQSSGIRRERLRNDLEEMMHGFGDQFPSNPATVQLVELFVIEYIEDLTTRALHVSELTGKLDKDCFLYLVRKDRKKFGRIHQLLTAQEEVKEAKKLIEDDMAEV